MTSDRERLARRWHDGSDHAADGTPFGGGVCNCERVAERLAPLMAEAQAEALRLVREVESDMANQAAEAWRSADARRGLSDHDALLVHADALTRWSERFRMAFEGNPYRAEGSA